MLVPKARFELARLVGATPSRWCVYQFHHFGIGRNHLPEGGALLPWGVWPAEGARLPAGALPFEGAGLPDWFWPPAGAAPPDGAGGTGGAGAPAGGAFAGASGPPEEGADSGLPGTLPGRGVPPGARDGAEEGLCPASGAVSRTEPPPLFAV